MSSFGPLDSALPEGGVSFSGLLLMWASWGWVYVIDQ